MIRRRTALANPPPRQRRSGSERMGRGTGCGPTLGPSLRAPTATFFTPVAYLMVSRPWLRGLAASSWSPCSNGPRRSQGPPRPGSARRDPGPTRRRAKPRPETREHLLRQPTAIGLMLLWQILYNPPSSASVDIVTNNLTMSGQRSKTFALRRQRQPLQRRQQSTSPRRPRTRCASSLTRPRATTRPFVHWRPKLRLSRSRSRIAVRLEALRPSPDPRRMPQCAI